LRSKDKMNRDELAAYVKAYGIKKAFDYLKSLNYHHASCYRKLRDIGVSVEDLNNLNITSKNGLECKRKVTQPSHKIDLGKVYALARCKWTDAEIIKEFSNYAPAEVRKAIRFVKSGKYTPEPLEDD